jgi:hypothetical protein
VMLRILSLRLELRSWRKITADNVGHNAENAELKAKVTKVRIRFQAVTGRSLS